MLVIVASRHDRQARELAERWPGAGLLTCEDLSVAGWRYAPDDPDNSVAVIDGQSIVANEIVGVLTRLPYVPEHELLRIAREDRSYVAAEMTAFLKSWLSSLGCPVLNRPDANCLSRPSWDQERWVHVAARLGIPVRPLRRRIELSADDSVTGPAPPGITVTVVGGHCFGRADEGLFTHARSLARAARVDLLSVRFGETADEPELLAADPFPDVLAPEVADTVLEYLGADQ